MSSAASEFNDLQRRRQVAEEAVRAAGEIQLRLLGGAINPRNKAGNPRDLLTEADLESDAAAKRIITAAFPNDTIVSEEDESSSEEVSQALSACWLIDPLDATLNFVHGFPIFGPAIAFVLQNKPIAAAVNVPVFGEVFSAARGLGASLNGNQIRVAGPKAFERALFVSHINNTLQPNLDEFMNHVGPMRSPAIHGSPLIAMCYLAAGRIDVFATLARNTLGPWDMAPGALMVEEAGGAVTGQLGAPLDLLVGGMAGASTFDLLDELWAAAGINQRSP